MCNVIDVETQNSFEYLFFPVSSGALRFKVKASNDAHIALTKGNFENNPMTEIYIGGWNNTKTIVQRNRSEPNKASVNTPDILNSDEYVGMWIRWYGGFIAAGLEGSKTPFISYRDPSPHPIDHVAVRTAHGSTGSWKIEVSPVNLIPPTPKPLPGSLRWEGMSTDDKIPIDAVVGGFENGEVLYVARARHNVSLCPGKYVPSMKKAVIPWGHSTHMKDTFEILCGWNVAWVKTKGDLIPPNAFPGGTAVETFNESLYIGRAMVDHNLIPGKIHVHYKTCYIPVGLEEQEVGAYEVLVTPTEDSIITRSGCGGNQYQNVHSDEDY